MMLSYIFPFQITVLTLLPLLVPVIAQTSGKTTRYWDCCKPSCAWPRDGITAPVRSCTGYDVVLKDVNAKSSCDGGGAYTCSDQTPWAVSDTLAYGFAAVSAAGGDANCCGCYELSFTSGPVSGKKMVVQATNTGGDVSSTQFDIAIPAGGVGIYDGCATQWGAKPAVWGQQYGGAATNHCSAMPKALQGGCEFRWGWMGGADNPTVNYKPITCPAEIVAKSGCARLDDTPSSAASGGSSSSNGSYSLSSSSDSAPAPPPTSLSTGTSVLSSSNGSYADSLSTSSTPLTSSTDSSSVTQTTPASSTSVAASSSSAPYSASSSTSSTLLTSSTDSSSVTQTTPASSTNAAASSSAPYSASSSTSSTSLTSSTDSSSVTQTTPASSTDAAASSSSAPDSASPSTSSTPSSSGSASAPPPSSPASPPTTTPTDSTSTPPPSSPTISCSSGSYQSPAPTTPTTPASSSAASSSAASYSSPSSSATSAEADKGKADKIGEDHKIHSGVWNGTGYGGTGTSAAAGKKKASVRCGENVYK